MSTDLPDAVSRPFVGFQAFVDELTKGLKVLLPGHTLLARFAELGTRLHQGGQSTCQCKIRTSHGQKTWTIFFPDDPLFPCVQVAEDLCILLFEVRRHLGSLEQDGGGALAKQGAGGRADPLLKEVLRVVCFEPIEQGVLLERRPNCQPGTEQGHDGQGREDGEQFSAQCHVELTRKGLPIASSRSRRRP
jgi:hypothetical protein